ncbi:MAG: ABC transporter permease [Gammaproteobacteria bacterium]
MNWSAQLHEGFLNLYSSKLRSLLALLGILVGTASVVAMVSGGELATNEALKQFKILGTDLLAVSVSDAAEKGNYEQHASLTVQQANDILTADNNVLGVAPYTQIYNAMQFNGHELNAAVLGVTESFANIVHVQMASGRFISDLDHYALYCVIGSGLYQQIKSFTLSDPIGQQIQVGQTILTIIGVAKPWPENSFVYANIDLSIMIPISTSTVLSKYTTISNIVMRLAQTSNSDAVQSQVQNYLDKTLPGKKFYFRSAKELIARMGKQSDILTIFLGLIGGVSLLVGGIGVMNIMLVSVVERRREIGIRLAVGANSKDIRSLFLFEAIMLGFTGGVLGVLVGIGISFIIALVSSWQFTLFLLPPLIGFTVSVATGVFFGFYPAHKASLLNPIEALRAE